MDCDEGRTWESEGVDDHRGSVAFAEYLALVGVKASVDVG